MIRKELEELRNKLIEYGQIELATTIHNALEEILKLDSEISRLKTQIRFREETDGRSSSEASQK